MQSPRSLTEAAAKELAWIEQHVHDSQVDRISAITNFKLLIFHTPHSPTGLLVQDNNLIEWIFLPHKSQKKLQTYVQKISAIIVKGRLRLWQLCGTDLKS